MAFESNKTLTSSPPFKDFYQSPSKATKISESSNTTNYKTKSPFTVDKPVPQQNHNYKSLSKNNGQLLQDLSFTGAVYDNTKRFSYDINAHASGQDKPVFYKKRFSAETEGTIGSHFKRNK